MPNFWIFSTKKKLNLHVTFGGDGFAANMLVKRVLGFFRIMICFFEGLNMLLF